MGEPRRVEINTKKSEGVKNVGLSVKPGHLQKQRCKLGSKSNDPSMASKERTLGRVSWIEESTVRTTNKGAHTL